MINYIKLYSDLLNIPLDNDLFYDLEINLCKENQILNSMKQELIQENNKYKDTKEPIKKNINIIKNEYENQISNLEDNLKQEKEKHHI